MPTWRGFSCAPRSTTFRTPSPTSITSSPRSGAKTFSTWSKSRTPSAGRSFYGWTRCAGDTDGEGRLLRNIIERTFFISICRPITEELKEWFPWLQLCQQVARWDRPIGAGEGKNACMVIRRSWRRKQTTVRSTGCRTRTRNESSMKRTKRKEWVFSKNFLHLHVILSLLCRVINFYFLKSHLNVSAQWLFTYIYFINLVVMNLSYRR